MDVGRRFRKGEIEKRVTVGNDVADVLFYLFGKEFLGVFFFVEHGAIGLFSPAMGHLPAIIGYLARGRKSHPLAVWLWSGENAGNGTFFLKLLFPRPLKRNL